jgi:hypothetical protein
VVYLIILFWYPSFLVISFGTIDLPAGRIVVLVLLLRCLTDSRIMRQFHWLRLDTWVAAVMTVSIIVPLITTPLMSTVENRGGFLIDTFFAYLVVRLIVTDKNTLISVLKLVSLALVPLALLGLVESVSGWQPFRALAHFCPWYFDAIDREEMRFGFSRAVGPFSHPILFGCGFAMFLPLVYFLRHQTDNWKRLAYVISVIVSLGVFSSMSSGPFVMFSVVVLCLIMERRKRLVKPLLICFLLLCVFVGIASNRPFYHVLVSYVNVFGGDSWHRAKLIDCAIDSFNEWYLVGYGDNDPGWGESLGMKITDVTNEFILSGVRYGILGVITLCMMLAAAFSSLVRAYRTTWDSTIKALCWALGSILFAVMVTWMSVSFFGQLVTLFYCFMGMIGSVYCFTQNIVTRANAVRFFKGNQMVQNRSFVVND